MKFYHYIRAAQAGETPDLWINGQGFVDRLKPLNHCTIVINNMDAIHKYVPVPIIFHVSRIITRDGFVCKDRDQNFTLTEEERAAYVS